MERVINFLTSLLGVLLIAGTSYDYSTFIKEENTIGFIALLVVGIGLISLKIEKTKP